MPVSRGMAANHFAILPIIWLVALGPDILRQTTVIFGKTQDVAYHFEPDCGRAWQRES